MELDLADDSAASIFCKGLGFPAYSPPATVASRSAHSLSEGDECTIFVHLHIGVNAADAHSASAIPLRQPGAP